MGGKLFGKEELYYVCDKKKKKRFKGICQKYTTLWFDAKKKLKEK